MMHYLTRAFGFSASHRLASAQRDAAENDAIYGVCTQLHGHNYRLEVTVRAAVDPAVGFACNVLHLDRVVQETVVAPCDHACLNEVALLAGVVPTMENIASRIWDRLESPLVALGVELYEVMVAETADSRVSLRRE